MARRERPVDPATGPLPAFAYELRKLRAEAGNPTYRVLAKSAGYSATTLSEAAGGDRLPTLDVLLAYVGACHGDVERWRQRWYETSAHQQSTADGSGPGGDTEPGALPGGEPPPLPAVSSGSSTAIGRADRRTEMDAGPRRRRRMGVLAVGAVSALVATVVAGEPSRPGGPRNGSTVAGAAVGGAVPVGPSCPGTPAGALFTGVTYGGGAHLRGGASRDAPLLTTIPPHCTVGFTGFCIGEKVYDNTGGTPDVRWFKAAGGGVVSSAVIHGNPPRTEPASECPNGRTAPTAITFSVTAGTGPPGTVTLHAAGADVDIVGFTRSTGTDPTSPDRVTWRQVSLADVRHPPAGAGVQLDVASTGPGQPILVAVACLGGDSPTGVVEARRAHPEHPDRYVPVVLSPDQRHAATGSACRYPNRG